MNTTEEGGIITFLALPEPKHIAQTNNNNIDK